MIIKGRARQNGHQLGKYLTQDAQKVNERVQVMEARGTTSQDARKALLEMSLAAELTKGRDGLYHASINPDKAKDQHMTEDEYLRAVDILEEELKFTGQARVVVLHEKHGRNHVHVVWQREKDGKLLSTSHNYLAHDRARGRMEQELKHEKTMQPRDIKKELSQAWKESKTGAEFIKRAEAQGYTIGRGYTTGRGGVRPFCVMDREGRKVDLVRQLPGVKTEEVKARLKDVETKLPAEKDLAGRKPVKDKANEQQRRQEEPDRERKLAAEKEATKQRMHKVAREAMGNFSEVVTPTQEKAQDNEKQRFEEKAKQASQNFSEVVTPKAEPQKEPTRAEKFAQQLAEVSKKKEQSRAADIAKAASENRESIKEGKPENEFERRLRQTQQNREDFGLEHEI